MSKSVAIIGTRGYPSYYGGFETAVRKIAPHLVDAGWDVTVYGRAGATHEDDPDIDRRVHSVFTRGMETKSLSTVSYGFTSAIHAAWKKPDVALVMNVANGFWLPILKLRRVPTVVNVDGIEWERAKWGRLAKAVFRWGARFTARFGDRMVYDSTVIADYWREHFALEGDFIPYGGDVPDELLLEPGLAHRRYVLVVARFVPENTVPEFIEAAKIIAEDHDVVIVGSSGYGGELDEAVQAIADQSDRVHWLGHISDDQRLLSLWQHAGAYFHGHSVGGTNPALVQAMACGAPIVARDTLYNREVLTEDGALFVEPVPEKIAHAVLELLADAGLQERMSSLVQQRARESYSWEGVCSAYAASLETQLAAKKS